MPKKLVAAISGGVDSSVAAAMAIEQGCELIAVTLKMRSCDNLPEKRKSCCGIEDDMYARGAAEKLGIPHYFLALIYLILGLTRRCMNLKRW